jgi:hypothetical protein
VCQRNGACGASCVGGASGSTREVVHARRGVHRGVHAGGSHRARKPGEGVCQHDGTCGVSCVGGASGLMR